MFVPRGDGGHTYIRHTHTHTLYKNLNTLPRAALLMQHLRVTAPIQDTEHERNQISKYKLSNSLHLAYPAAAAAYVNDSHCLDSVAHLIHVQPVYVEEMTSVRVEYMALSSYLKYVFSFRFLLKSSQRFRLLYNSEHELSLYVVLGLASPPPLLDKSKLSSSYPHLITVNKNPSPRSQAAERVTFLPFPFFFLFFSSQS